ncbi:hypothetical protein K438DRAFT_1960868 [Mycena galopus ATCC 62051]|nr:hypothetical protein K438DRAFT_1960868 [Mycena galopus ATCC 62051]
MQTKILDIVPNKNGFVATLLDAYTQDRALVIRPDDVWLAILSQFNFFVNARAELLRANFVAHEGKQELEITVDPATRHIDFGHIARQFVGLLEKNVVDPTLRAWAAPDFTTTTVNDTTVSAVMLMATLRKYFNFSLKRGGCGIPRVTLEGERSDWVNILGRLEKLKEYGLETTAWYHLLRPCVAHYTPGGSGKGNHYTGWITAFTVFSKDGRWMGNPLNAALSETESDHSLTAAQFWAKYGSQYIQKDLVLDGAPFRRLHSALVPPGYGEVDVLLIDDVEGECFECAMVAGSIGMRVSSSGDRSLSPEGADDTVQPLVGWWLFVKDETDMEQRARNAYALKRIIK